MTEASAPKIDWQPDVDPPVLRLTGPWRIRRLAALSGEPSDSALPGSGTVVVDGSGLEALDTAGAWMIRRLCRRLADAGLTIERRGFSARNDALVRLVEPADGTVEEATRARYRRSLLGRVGERAAEALDYAFGLLSFAGELVVCLIYSLRHPSRLRWRELVQGIYRAGYQALPITGLLAFLLGVVIAYQGASLLRAYGADIFVVDLVALSMVRELAPMITAIIVAGRTGSAYTAQIGTMSVTEEVEALRTIGIGPMELLVLPKVLALVIALPLLTLFSDVVGILGGVAMAKMQLGIGVPAFTARLADAVSFESYLIGLVKTPVFAAVIALVGCFQGFRVSGGAASVGEHTTASVVQSIFLVIVLDAAFSVLFSGIGL